MPPSVSAMLSAAITHLATLPRLTGPLRPETKAELARDLPKLSIRRFSEGGLLVHRVLSDLALGDDEPMVLATTFGESRSLEAFIDSFPTPSPASFQRSIHPSAAQQHRVTQNRPLRTFLPIAGHDGIPLVAVRTALQVAAPSVVLVGYEETGSWSVEIGAGSAHGFAFAIRLSHAATDDALGWLQWSPVAPGEAGTVAAGLDDLHAHLHERQPWQIVDVDFGTLSLRWKVA